MRFLRTAPTRRLLGVIGGSAAAIAGCAAIAIAATSGGAVPRPASLADAVHRALSARPVRGITARITFTNHLIDSSNIVGVDPILSGATGRLWLSDDHRVRIELQSDRGDAQAIVSNGRFFVYDPGMNTVYEGATGTVHRARERTPAKDTVPTGAEISKTIAKVLGSANLNGATAPPVAASPTDVGGQAAYSVSISPKHDGGLLGSVELAWDAAHGVPLDLAIRAAGQSAPVLELRADSISYGPIPPSTFNVTPPPDAKVVHVAAPSNAPGHRPESARSKRARKSGPHTVAQVQQGLAFALAAPDTLAGLPRHDVRSVTIGSQRGALVTYGRNLGGIAVLEEPASASNRQRLGALTYGKGEGRTGLSLPTVSIGGATAQELDTALGTMIRFTRGSVSYTVVGSVPAAAAEAAARAL